MAASRNRLDPAEHNADETEMNGKVGWNRLNHLSSSRFGISNEAIEHNHPIHECRPSTVGDCRPYELDHSSTSPF